MTETGGHNAPSPLIETNWLAERLDHPDLRTLDCSVIMNVADGDRLTDDARTASHHRRVSESLDLKA